MINKKERKKIKLAIKLFVSSKSCLLNEIQNLNTTANSLFESMCYKVYIYLSHEYIFAEKLIYKLKQISFALCSISF